jgi:hypothetical protein
MAKQTPEEYAEIIVNHISHNPPPQGTALGVACETEAKYEKIIAHINKVYEDSYKYTFKWIPVG